MSFFKNLFKNSDKSKVKKVENHPVSLSLDDSFVHNFIKLGGKFLYCQKEEDITNNIVNIIQENSWDSISYKNPDLLKFVKSIGVNLESKLSVDRPLFTSCESLISENGNLLFSSNQIGDCRLSTLTNNFIVFATTSQIVKSKDESLTGIKLKYKGNLPTNISPIKNYTLEKTEDNFLNYGTNNSKNLYLLLLEDL